MVTVMFAISGIIIAMVLLVMLVVAVVAVLRPCRWSGGEGDV